MIKYYMLKVVCPIGEEIVTIEDCQNCEHFEGLDDNQYLLMCGF